jgi:hypothetical protein
LLNIARHKHQFVWLQRLRNRNGKVDDEHRKTSWSARLVSWTFADLLNLSEKDWKFSSKSFTHKN